MNLTHLWSSLSEFSKRNINKRITLAASITSIVVFKGPVPLRMKSQIQLRMAIWGRARDWDSVGSNLDTGRFPSNQNFPKFGNGGKSYRNFPEKFPEIPETVDSPGAKLTGKKTSRKKNWKFGYTSRGCPAFGIFWKCRSIRSWKLSKIQTRRFGWMESAPSF